MVLRWMIFVCGLLTVRIGGQDWSEPRFVSLNPQDIVLGQYDEDHMLQEIWMVEELAVPFDFIQINYHGTASPEITDQPNTLGAVVRKTANSITIQITRRQDYEIQSHRSSYVLLTVENIARPYSIVIYLVNILDNVPVMTSEEYCIINELQSNFDSDCFFNVYHADGFETNGIRNSSTNMLTFELEDKNGVPGHFTYVEDTSKVEVYNKRYKLHVEKALNYTERALFNFYTVVFDLDATHSFKMSTIVQVRNVESRNPIFIKPFTTERILEKSPFETVVIAIDGDTEINKQICYEIQTVDTKYSKYFKIGRDTGVLEVSGIDRDTEENEFYPFTITAFKCDNTRYNTTSEGAIILEDINDCYPEIVIEPLELEFWENTVMELAFDESFVHDRDLGENAKYDVSLTEVVDGLESPTDSFAIIPTSGYQRAIFAVNIPNASKLDYEDPKRRQFRLVVNSQEQRASHHFRTQAIEIKLKNWNDEVPKFDEVEYQSNILETTGGDEEIIKVTVTDRDVDDDIVLSIQGRMSENLQITKLSAEQVGEGEEPSFSFLIKTGRADIFDYDVAQEVIVQLLATDQLQTEKQEPLHRVYSQLTIGIIDVNNKPPQITLPSGIVHIRENSVAETPLIIGENEVVKIIGYDPDTEADLQFAIDWSNSYGIKSGVRAKENTYVNCFYIDAERPNRHDIIGIMKVNPEFKLQVDYEMYETLFLRLRLVDRNQTIMPNTAEVMFTVQIDDENDNAPEFSLDTLTAKRFVKEQSESGVTVGTIFAYDIDGPGNNEITYTMKPINPRHDGWMSIDQTGIIRVDGDRLIDCDEPPIDTVVQTVIISDGYWEKSHEFIIDIYDTNNKKPYQETIVEGSTRYLFEKSVSRTEIVRFQGKDKDRDLTFHTVSYEINYRAFPQLQDFFEISQAGLVYVKDNNQPLDRDAGLESITINIVMVDNAGGFDIKNREEVNMKLVLLDINDHYPELPEEDYELLEDSVKGHIVREPFSATDLDDRNTPNAKINYRIVAISPGGDHSPSLQVTQDFSDLFVLDTVDEYSAAFKIGTDLKGYYGKWNVEVQSCDRGSEYVPIIPLPEKGENKCRNRTYDVNVTPYNYQAPSIVYPTNNMQLRLKYESLHNGRPLNDTNGSTIPNFSAIDDDGGIFGEVTFSLKSTNPTETAHDVFRVDKVDRTTGQLVLENAPAIQSYPKRYSITVVAQDGGGKQSESPITVVFIDMEGDPAFVEPTFHTDFTENIEGQDERRQLPFAEDPKNAGLPPEDQTDVFYFIDVTYGNASQLFALDPQSNVLQLTTLLDREEIPSHEIRVVATNNRNGPPATIVDTSPALLVVQIKVNDVNDNPPVFQQRFYGVGITTSDMVPKPLFRVFAEDPDEDEVIRYEIVMDSVSAVGENIHRDSLPFELNPTTGQMTLTEKLQSSMKGYYEFNIIAWDKDDTHSDTVPAKIYIVSESNRVKFVFLNSVAELDKPDVRNFLAEQFSKFYEMECFVDDIDQSVIDRQTGGNTRLTDVRAHFVRDNQAVEALEIQEKSSNRIFVTELKTVLSEQQLLLQDVPVSVPVVSSDVNDTLQTVLIVLAAALAALCLILFVAFLIKIRSLNRQLKALSTTDFVSIASDSEMKKKGRNVPTTNIFSVEGSNPVLNDTEYPRMGGGVFDDLSIQSDESDFVDMDNDIFAPSKRESLNPALLEHIKTRSLNPMANAVGGTGNANGRPPEPNGQQKQKGDVFEDEHEQAHRF